jgi:hypothetical protein
MTIEEIQAEIDAINAERQDLFAQKAPIDARLVQLYGIASALADKRDKMVIESATEPDWASLIRKCGGDQTGSIELLRYFDKNLRDRFDMWHSGYWVKTGDPNINVKVNKDDSESYNKNLAGVKFFLPLLRPHEDGYVHFGIFEHTLSAGGSFYLKVKSDGSWCIVGGRYHTYEFCSIEAALSFIQKNHWYGDED